MTLLYIAIGLAFFVVAFVMVVMVAAIAYLIIGSIWLATEIIHSLTTSHNKESQ